MYLKLFASRCNLSHILRIIKQNYSKQRDNSFFEDNFIERAIAFNDRMGRPFFNPDITLNPSYDPENKSSKIRK